MKHVKGVYLMLEDQNSHNCTKLQKTDMHSRRRRRRRFSVSSDSKETYILAVVSAIYAVA